ncbi:tachykinin-like peptides receptor 99D [Anneissia japonica]|uniref:tachykinin-like peptides receptor 99D n=1 Tax=Anneissia japonica TaxID=1529436 RepID=UPI0014255F00|nr:tachykinin-like peptides receptor 99D [Anneissia japonica]
MAESDYVDPILIQTNDYILFNLTYPFEIEPVSYFWAALFVATIITAAGGNIIVIWIVLTNPRMRTVTNCFLVNLAVADVLTTSFNMIPASYMNITQNWIFGKALCRISTANGYFCVMATVFSLVAITLDRYRAIVYPLKPRLSKLTTIAIVVIIWSLSAAFAYPALFYSTTLAAVYALDDTLIHRCYIDWPDGQQNYGFDNFIYHMCFTVFTYVLPLCIMTVCYSVIGVKLWGGKMPGESVPNRPRPHLEAKRRVVKMIVVVVTIFALCWLPVHVYFLLSRTIEDIYLIPYIQHVYYFTWWLSMSNSMCNPFIYCWLNDRFRKGFQHVFRCLPCVKAIDPPEKPVNRSRTSNFTMMSMHSTSSGKRTASRNSSFMTTTMYECHDSMGDDNTI